MPEATLYTAGAKKKGSYALPDEFDGTVNKTVLYHAVRAFRNNQRQGTASTKTRSEVSGGGRKPYRQKGTGRARQGTIRAPHYPGGGVAFGPKPRSYQTDLNRKVKRLARQSALNARAFVCASGSAGTSSCQSLEGGSHDRGARSLWLRQDARGTRNSAI